MIDIVALGYIFNEKIQWPDGRIEGPYLGSTLSYGAVALGNLEANAGLVSNIGPETPKTLLQPLFDCGINLEGLNVCEDASEVKNLLIYREDGTKEIKYLSRSPEILFEDIPKSYHDALIFHLCLVDYDVPIKTIDAIKAVNQDAIFSADLGGVGGAHSTVEMREKYIDRDNGILQKEYLKRIDIGKASIEDAELVFGKKFSNSKDVAKAYIDSGVKMMIVTMGKDGAYVLSKDGSEKTIPAIPPRKVLDTTGAGDTFLTAFIVEYLKKRDIENAAIFASATSSLLIEKTGGVQVSRTPTKKQVLERIKKHRI